MSAVTVSQHANDSDKSPEPPPRYSLVIDSVPAVHQQQDSNSAKAQEVNQKKSSNPLDGAVWSAKDAEANRTASDAGHGSHSGYGVFVTALFIIGEMVGGGIVSMPNAVFRQGWVGIPIIALVGMASGYTGAQLGWCWTILQQRWPEVYMQHTQKPYPEMGFRAFGPWCRKFVSVCTTITLFGTATVFLILASENIASLILSWTNTDISFCYFVLIIAALLTPITFLGSPKDFWQVGLGAAIATTIAVVIMLIGMSMDHKKYEGKVTHPAPDFVSFILGYGTIMFAYSGQSAFPTIQHDMKEPSKFPKAVMGSYSVIFLYYLPVSILGYIVYGHLLDGETILPLLPHGWVHDTVVSLITIHVLFGFIIFINPLNQEIEHAFKIPNRFTWKRLVTRTVCVVAVVFVAETLPSFNVLLNLIGGTTMAFLTFVFPGAFYLMLRWKTSTKINEVDTPIRKWEYPINFIIITVGVVGAFASVAAAIITIATGSNLFKKPCYVNGGF
jgi:vesicular inhibitory amino acid transporter